MAPKPFYSIAHRVLTKQGVLDAVANGVNAVEIDLTAYDDGWWADHDQIESGLLRSRGDTARAMFEIIAQQRQVGKTITFVWFDIKTPDKYPSGSVHGNSTFAALRALGREILEPQGVRVLYGFYETANCAALQSLKGTLTSNEAVNLDGPVDAALTVFEANGVTNRSQRVLSRGLFDLDLPETVTKIIGIAKGGQVNFNTILSDLKQSVQSEQVGLTFAWTVLAKRGFYVDKLLYEAGINGMIHGLPANTYVRDADTKLAAKTIHEWIKDHGSKYRMAKQEDAPW